MFARCAHSEFVLEGPYATLVALISPSGSPARLCYVIAIWFQGLDTVVCALWGEP